jgi:hypothetical protein
METIGTPHGERTAQFGDRGAEPQVDTMKDKATLAGRNVRDRAIEMLDGRKDEVCGLIEQLANTMERDRVGRFASTYVRRGSEYLRHHSAEQILSSARGATGGLRERPAMLLGACFVGGLALARLMRR